jgi:hypothetical protein
MALVRRFVDMIRHPFQSEETREQTRHAKANLAEVRRRLERIERDDDPLAKLMHSLGEPPPGDC